MRGVLQSRFLVLLPAVLLPVIAAADTVYETQTQFVNRAFNGSPPDARVIWLSGGIRQSVKQLLGHDYPALRLRYWCLPERTAWVLEEVGKELPITVGVVVDHHQIESLRVMVYRENRGGEVSTPAFTDQFNGAALNAEKALGKEIDGITGATLSVRALTRLAAMALYLHEQSACDHGA
jgi:hypothetical protein